MKRKIHILLLVVLLPLMLFGQTRHTIRPNKVDSLSGSPNNNHFVYTNQTITQKNKLFLFFPGTGAVPYNYRKILKHAASLGYHSIGLTYPNADAINAICLTTTDTTCHSRARLEVFDGIDRHPDLNVDTNNCIKRRTVALLQYLAVKYPSENWGQYYSGDHIRWSNVIVSGHSQGGGHAGIISKINQVERVVMFAAMDWIPFLNRNAGWITRDGPTPANRYYGFIHQRDEAVDFNKVVTTWDNYGMDRFGDLVLVDTTNKSFNNSHQLYTLLTPANDSTKFHGSIVADPYTPFSKGSPVYEPVWTYMIAGKEPNTSASDQPVQERITVFPNPVHSILYVNGNKWKNSAYSIYNRQGQIVKKGSVTKNKINVSNLSSGIYFLSIIGKNLSQSIKFIKS